MIDVDVHLRGPVVEGHTERIMRAYMTDAEQQVAQRGENLVHQRLGHVLKHPTGYYESRIQTERAHDGFAVNDGGVVYGPWLEGVGSRNRTTRFKGYFTFRLVSQQLDGEAGDVAERVLRERFLGRLS